MASECAHCWRGHRSSSGREAVVRNVMLIADITAFVTVVVQVMLSPGFFFSVCRSLPTLFWRICRRRPPSRRFSSTTCWNTWKRWDVSCNWRGRTFKTVRTAKWNWNKSFETVSVMAQAFCFRAFHLMVRTVLTKHLLCSVRFQFPKGR